MNSHATNVVMNEEHTDKGIKRYLNQGLPKNYTISDKFSLPKSPFKIETAFSIFGHQEEGY